MSGLIYVFSKKLQNSIYYRKETLSLKKQKLVLSQCDATPELEHPIYMFIYISYSFTQQ